MEISSSARLIGSIKMGRNVVIAQGTVLRSEDNSLSIGNGSWVLENSTVIGSPEHPTTIGRKTIFGHKCVAIGATIGDLCEIGNSTVFLPGCVVGDRCIFGEGTIITGDMTIPSDSVVVGRPGRVIRRATPDDIAMITRMRGNDISLDDTELTTVRGEIELSNIYAFGEKFPEIAESAIIFDSAEITGDVTIGENSVIGAGVRIIGNSHGPIIIGDNVQILENSVLHLLPDNQLILKDNVVIGPQCMIHGTIIGENSVVESGAIICDNSSLGVNTLVKSGTLVKQRDEFQDNAILEGFPAKVIGENLSELARPDWAVRNIK